MSKQVEKDSVFRTTKVRTKLKGDASWLQRNSDAETETDKEKPWLAEVRASRLNGAPVETSPVSSPTTSTPSPTKSDAERAPSSGFLIRGIFTKLDKPTSSSTTNGVSPSTTQFTKKPSESYKKIAPYTVRPTPENQEDQLSNEEQEKRTEAASNVLKKSTVRQRSYVLSAAKKYESPETSLANRSPAFVARRVETTDDDGSAATPAPASALPPSPVVPVASVASKPETKPWKAVDTSVRTAVDVAVNEPVAPKVVEPAPEPMKDDPPPVSVTVEDTFEDMKPVATPLPVVIPKCFQAASTEPEPKHSDFSWKVDTHLVDLAPASPSPISPTSAAPAPASRVPFSPTQTSPVPLSPTQAVDVAVNEPVAPKVVEPAPEPVKDDPPPMSVTVEDTFEDMKPVATPLPVVIPKCFQAASTEPEPKHSDFSWKVDTHLVDLTPASPSPISPTSAAPAPASRVPFSPTQTSPVPLSPSQTSPVPLSPTQAVDVAVNEPVAPKVVEPAPDPVKDDPPPVSVTVEDTFEDMKPVATPLPVVIPKCFQAASTEPEPKHSDFSWKVDTHLVDLAPASPSPISPPPAAPAPASPVPLSPTQAFPVPLSPTQAVDVAVNEPVAPKVVEPAPEPVKDDPPPMSVTVEDTFEDMKPVATPLPVVIPKCFQAASTEPEPKHSDFSWKVDTHLVDLAPASPSPISPPPAAPAPASPVPLSPTQAFPVPLSPTQAVDVAVNEPVAPKVVEPAPEPVKDDPPPMSVTVEDTFEDMKPVATPLPVVIPKCFQAASTEPEPKHSDFSWKVDTHLVDLAPASPSPISPPPAAPAPASPVPLSPTQAYPVPFSPTQAYPVPPSPTQASPIPLSPTQAYPVPLSPTQASPVPLSPTLASPVPLSPTQAYPVPLSPTLASPVPLSPTQAYPVPLSPTLASPVPLSPTQASPVPLSPTQASPVPLSPTQASPVPLSPTLASPVPLSPAPVSAVTEILVKTEPEPEMAPKPSRKSSSRVDTLTTLSDTLIAFDSSSTSFKDDEPVLAEEEAGSANSHTTENGVEQEPAPELSSSSIPMTDDLLAFTNGPEESAEPVPPSPGRWSQDLLSGLNSESKTSGTLDLLADNVIPIKTRSLSMQREEKQTDETAKETQSLTETVTITTKTVIITDKSQEDNADPWSSRETTTVTESSSADPFDPYPIGTTSSNSASDLIQPRSDISSNSASVTFMENRYPSPETDLSTQRSWARTWETSPPQQADTEESQEAIPGGQTVDQETLIKFERKSSENDSPWDRWTSPTVYTITTTTGGEGEEEKEKERTEYSETETITTITTIRERHSEQQLAMDRYGTYSSAVTEEDQRVQTPEPEARKSFVYVKEYVNATELSMHNARDSPDNGSDYLTSSSANYSYSSPSTYSSGLLSSTCNFCGETVGNDAKITIEHLNINCHPTCFKCGVCRKPMGDLLDSMFLHDGKVLCETCYSNSLD